MKKILMILLICLIPSFSFAAESEDMSVYLRKDVFDAKMEAFMSEIRLMNEQLRSDIKALDSKIDKVNENLSTRIDATNAKIDSVNEKLNAKIDSVNENLNTKIDSVNENLNTKIDSVNANLNSRIDSMYENLSARIDVTNARITDLQTLIYWGLGAFGLFIAFSALAPALGEFFGRLRRPLPDFEAIARRLIEENNAKLESRLFNVKQ